MVTGSKYFSTDILNAREKFLSICDQNGLRVQAYAGHATGSAHDDQPIFCDVTRLGSPDAPKGIMILSGAGGGSSYCASACLNGLLREKLYLQLPRDVALILVHAINPKGPIWANPYQALNRVSSQSSKPSKQDVKPKWDNDLLNAAEVRVQADQENQNLMTANPNHFDRNNWANLTLSAMAQPAWNASVQNAIATQYLSEFEDLLVLDIRTGPGEFARLDIFDGQLPSSLIAQRLAKKFLNILYPGQSAHEQPNAVLGGGISSFSHIPNVATLIGELGMFEAGSGLETLIDEQGKTKIYLRKDWQNFIWPQVKALFLQAITYIQTPATDQ
jgi:hypothetical protein